MSKGSQSKIQQSPKGHLLILGCSDKKTKNPNFDEMPALEVYDGPNYRVLRKFLRENGWPPGLIIKIISAKHKIIDATELIEPYNERLDKKAAKDIRQEVMQNLEELKSPKTVFINMGKDYLPAISCITTLFGDSRVEYAGGGIGKKMQKMKQWLHDLPNSTASVNLQEQSNGPPLYFFPDWDDYVYEPFKAEETGEDRRAKNRKYAHEVFEDNPPYDGLLLSLAQLLTKKGPLNQLAKKSSFNLREERRIPKNMCLFGDCGAFSYTTDPEPPFSPEYAAFLYNQFDFDLGASVDHIPISSLPDEEKQRRMNLTSENARKFLATHLSHNYQFVPVGCIQGVTPDDYANFVGEYIEWGYKHIALGGLVRRQDSEILQIVTAVREALQKHTRGKDENIWVHIFGILRPNLQSIFTHLGSIFTHLGVASFDSASYLRKAWACPNKNYLRADGKWYGSIRIPFSTSKSMQEVAKSDPKLANGTMQELEKQCLTDLELFDKKKISEQEVLESVNQYSALLERKKTYNHLSKTHQELLSERPWKKCKCKVCKDAGINIVVFRGANRNRRRGFHNTWVFYHKILHGKHKKSAKK